MEIKLVIIKDITKTVHYNKQIRTLKTLIHSRQFALIGCIFVNLDYLFYSKGYWPVVTV